MNNRFALVLLVLLCLGLGAGWIFSRKQATERHQDDLQKIAALSNNWVSTSSNLEEQRSVSDNLEKDLLKLLGDEGRTVRINDSFHLHKDAMEKIRADLKKYLDEKKEITMAEFRDLAKTSRKFAVPLMEYFDSQKLTQRIGDKRVLRG